MAQLPYIIASLHVFLCPFTKVEESFNIQAFHDILYHRFNLSQYDHNEFPGVVPRTFIGPLIVTLLSAPIIYSLHMIGISKLWSQYVVRLTLALLVISAWTKLRNTLQKQFGYTFSWWFTLITVTQYHFMFYMSRPLPNIMALPLVLLSFDGWLQGKTKQFISMAGAAIIIFRAELAMLFGLFLIVDIYSKKVTFQSLLKIVIPVGLGLVTITVVVDSIFWGRLLWPEAEVFWFNTILNKSSNWGTSPFLWYFYSALPRGLGPSLVLVPVGMYLDRRMIQFAAPAFVYILLYSVLPHKELRFIIYVFPLLNMCSAAACSYIYIRRTKAPIYELMFWGTIVIVIGNVVLTSALVSVSMSNYPGGVAITRFHKLLKDEPFVHVHISNLAAQTGVTRFHQVRDEWIYSKNESLSTDQLQAFTHLIVEAKSKYSPTVKAFSKTHVILDSIESFYQVNINYKLIPPIKIKTRPSLFTLQRKDFGDYHKGRSINNIEVISEELSEEETQAITTRNLNNKHPTPAISITSSETFEKDIITSEATEEPITNNYSKKGIKDEDTENDNKYQESELDDNNDFKLKLSQSKKILNDLKSMRQEKKKNAIQKIKSETRKEVIASAKEKLKEIMKRHKHIADELSENIISENELETREDEIDGRGDIPEEILSQNIEFSSDEVIEKNDSTLEIDLNKQISSKINHTHDNINVIVEEVIVRLIDRKIYDDKTKPEDIKTEDRQAIQKIVEEILSERTNYSEPKI